MSETIFGVVSIKIIGPGYTDDPGDPATGKPYVQITAGETTMRVTLNVAEMIGGVGRGANARFRGTES